MLKFLLQIEIYLLIIGIILLNSLQIFSYFKNDSIGLFFYFVVVTVIGVLIWSLTLYPLTILKKEPHHHILKGVVIFWLMFFVGICIYTVFISILTKISFGYIVLGIVGIIVLIYIILKILKGIYLVKNETEVSLMELIFGLLKTIYYYFRYFF